MAFDSNYQYFKGYTWSFMATRTGKEKEKGQLTYPSPLTHTHNRRIRGKNPASGGARSSPGASGYDGPSLDELEVVVVLQLILTSLDNKTMMKTRLETVRA